MLIAAARNHKLAENLKARNKPLPAYLSDELKLSKTEITNIDKQLAQRKLSMAATNTRYTEEKARFIALKQSTPQVNTGEPARPAVNDANNAVKANNMAATLTTQP